MRYIIIILIKPDAPFDRLVEYLMALPKGYKDVVEKIEKVEE